MTKKLVSTSINLPVESVYSIVDVDNKKVEISIQDAFAIFNRKKR